MKKSTSKKARTAPGVLAVYTGEDLAAAKVGGLPCGWLITDVNGQPMKEPPHPLLAQGKVRYVGEHVAVVIAETLDQARDAAELVEVDYEVLPAVVNAPATRRAGRRSARRGAGQHLLRLGDRRQGGGRRGASPRRAHVTKLEFINNRLIPNAIEPRAAIGDLLARRRRLHALRRQPEPARRAAADDGVRAGPARAQGARDRARRRRRLRLQDLPVRRGRGRHLGGEAAQPPGEVDRGALASPSSRTRTAATTSPPPSWRWTRTASSSRMRVKTTANMGAYLSTFASCVPTILYATLLAGQYTTPLDPLRGDGGVHQHRAGGRLPRRRPARGDLRGRAAGRDRGARDEDRPGRDPPAQLHPPASRTRRRSRCSTTPATTTRRWTRR